jgi:hypothetical protein
MEGPASGSKGWVQAQGDTGGGDSWLWPLSDLHGRMVRMVFQSVLRKYFPYIVGKTVLTVRPCVPGFHRLWISTLNRREWPLPSRVNR